MSCGGGAKSRMIWMGGELVVILSWGWGVSVWRIWGSEDAVYIGQ